MVALSTRHRALSLVPVAALSAAWTVGFAAADPTPSSPVGSTMGSVGIPDAVTGSSITAPASATIPARAARRAGLQQARAVDPVSAIPAAALTAYQRAAAVITASDPTCGIDWSLLAAIGEIESDHGREVARPLVVGADTDGGEYDGDVQHDRAVGPLRLIPSTWSSVKVDGDGDGVRDPQDLDDAALAAAVHLCSGAEDLSTAGGRRAALLRYDPAPGYAALVLSWAGTYATSATTGSWAFAAAPAEVDQAPTARSRRPAPTKPARPTKPAGIEPAKPVAPEQTPLPAPRPDPVRDVLTVTSANLVCTLQGLSSLLQPAAFAACVDDRLNRTTDR